MLPLRQIHTTISHTFRIRFGLLAVSFLFAGFLFAQDTAKIKPIPDGTMGETLEPADSIEKKKFPKNLNLFNGRFSSLRIGVGFLPEYAAFKQDANAKKQMDSAGVTVEDQWKVRDFRVFASGQFTTKRLLTWKLGLMYDGPNREWLVRETGLTIGVPEISGHIFIGRTKEGYSQNKVMNGYAGWTMERQMALDVIPILADGIKWIGFWPKNKIVWNAGVYANWLSKNQAFSTYKWQMAARVAWLPIFKPDEKNMLHVGINYRYGKPEDGKMRLRSRPEANPAPYFVDTDVFDSKHSNHFGTEIYYIRGPLMLGSEYHWHNFEIGGKGSQTLHGGDAVISYFLTGGSRPYSTVSGVYSFVPVKKSIFKKGLGEIELLLRYSMLDLNGETIQGGEMRRITPMVNWYMTRYMRLEFAYGYGVLNRFAMEGVTQFYQARMQFAIL